MSLLGRSVFGDLIFLHVFFKVCLDRFASPSDIEHELVVRRWPSPPSLFLFYCHFRDGDHCNGRGCDRLSCFIETDDELICCDIKGHVFENAEGVPFPRSFQSFFPAD